MTLPQLRALIEFWTEKPKKGKGKDRGIIDDLDMFNMTSGIKRVRKAL